MADENTKTCFVIAPIGEPESPTRKGPIKSSDTSFVLSWNLSAMKPFALTKLISRALLPARY